MIHRVRGVVVPVGWAWLPRTLWLALASLSPLARAQTPLDLGECVGLAAADARLACYDKLASRSQMLVLPASPTAEPQVSAPVVVAAPAVTGTNSRMSRYWELDDGDKRGAFNYTAYRPNYFMPLRTSSHGNPRPYTPTQGYADNLPAYKRLETKLQLSLRTKLIQDVLVPGGDLWVAYTQESNWQLYNHGASAPFRNTDYQPEAILWRLRRHPGKRCCPAAGAGA